MAERVHRYSLAFKVLKEASYRRQNDRQPKYAGISRGEAHWLVVGFGIGSADPARRQKETLPANRTYSRRMDTGWGIPGNIPI